MRISLMKTQAAIVLVSALITGCAGGLKGDTYTREDARKVQQVQYGVVESAIPVVIEGNRQGIVGTGAGTIIGGLAGSTVGKGRGAEISAVLGAVVGGIAGSSLEEGLTRAQGQEITVQMEDGRVLSIVQEVEEENFFRPGDRIRLLRLNGVTRVSY